MNPLPVPGQNRILVVDDSESNRYVLATWLRRAGHDVMEASTGAEALRIFDAGFIDLVVLDINLPDMTGYEVCEAIKANRRPRTVPVLHVSATAIEPADRSEGLRRGADGYLVEPVEREELLASVEALLRGAAAQRTAFRLAYRLRRLNDATLAINEAATLEHLVTTIAREACAVFEASALVTVATAESGFMASAEPGGEARFDASVAEAVDTIRRAAVDYQPVPGAFLGRFVPASESGLFLSADLSEPGGHRGNLFIAVPGPVQGDLPTDETDVVLEQFARAATSAIRNMRTFDIERQIALTLQQSLLPDMIPAIAKLDVAVRYKASAEHAEVGGDFYEIFSLGDEHVCVAIGNVVGHSLEAAAVMAQLRTGVRSYMLEGHGPRAVLGRLNQLLLRFHPDVTATVCCAIFNHATGQCELANAGHPAPVLKHGETVTFLPNGGPLLGVEAVPAKAHLFTIAPDDVLLFFTDGLIERRHEDFEIGLERLARSMAAPIKDLDELCDRVLREAGPASMTDDIALVALRPRDS